MAIWQLMKNLRDKGWIPRWYNEVIHTVYDKKHKMIWLYKEGKKYLELVYKKSLRDLCSKESWLWQFCVENEMVFIPKWEIPYVERNYIFDYECYEVSEFQYWLMVWALLKEDELEQFLLDNIKIDGK